MPKKIKIHCMDCHKGTLYYLPLRDTINYFEKGILNGHTAKELKVALVCDNCHHWIPMPFNQN